MTEVYTHLLLCCALPAVFAVLLLNISYYDRTYIIPLVNFCATLEFNRKSHHKGVAKNVLKSELYNVSIQKT